ncbi:P-loop NTPase family protein [Methylobrevis albus]|uniref:DnaA regulatory inactivator Hda n=1 Tax=Methylobrevis albus TaxID=2793297 RepID=A0A931I478_9HYPH|nr:hypothetical protein [Methylobrevis albus]MBH0239940.1 hypothetical protein [Methylobrevis albus]
MTPAQLPIPIAHVAALGRDDFVVGDANRAAWGLVGSWRDWAAPVAVLAGPAGSGKSHLLRVFADEAGATLLAGPDLAGRDPLALAGRPVALDDADAAATDPAAFFHLVNAVRAAGGRLLAAGRGDAAGWPAARALRDLASRLRAAQPVRLGAPDDDLLARVLVKLFADRQIDVDRSVIDYLLPRIERSYAAASAIVQRLDEGSLARGRPLGRGLAAKILAESHGDEDTE